MHLVRLQEVIVISQNMQQRAPKRRIERVYNVISQQITDSAVTEVLHSPEDAKTLVRMVGEIHFYAVTGTGVQIGTAIIRCNRSGVSVIEPEASESKDQDSPVERIAQYPFLVNRDTTNQQYIKCTWKFDIKAQRKLKPGDDIVFAALGGTSAFGNYWGTVDLWFKE